MTPAQVATLRAYIEANPTWMAYPHNSNGADEIAKQLNALTVDYYVWNNRMSTQAIFDAISWSALTPTDTPDGTQAWANRSLCCQGKQFNIQTILSGRETIDGSKANVRAGLQDALTNIPSGVAGAIVSAGWTSVRDGMKKLATGIEKALATGTGTLAAPAVAPDVTSVGFSEIQQLMEWA